LFLFVCVTAFLLHSLSSGFIKFYFYCEQDIDVESVEVKCMTRIGHSRFYWPQMDDIIWYNWNDVIMSIPEPTKVTDRHRQIDPDKFAVMEAQLNI